MVDCLKEVLMNEKTIWHERQNKPSLIVQDLRRWNCWLSRDKIYEILLKRGVFKWFAVRRQLIKLKNTWKTRVTESIARQKQAAHNSTRAYERGYRDGVQECRAEVRALCHSSRWQAPDNDRKAQDWLRKR